MRERLRSDERGFTLLELLVAITIISILLAISAQSYYHQRRKGWMAQTKSSVRNMASAENSHVYAGGALSFTQDLDDLWHQGYRYSTDTVIPHVALATTQNFCVQVNSAHDPSIVWHFSSEVGYPQEGPATASSCGDLDGVGSYRTSGTGARDGVTSSGIEVAAPDPGVTGDASRPETGDEGDSSTSGDGSSTSGTTVGSESDGPGGTSAGRDGDGDGEGDDASSGGDEDYHGPDPSGGTTSAGDDSGSTTGGGSGNGNSGSGTGNGNGNGKNDGTCKNGSDPDGDANGGADKPGGSGGTDQSDQDCDNGSGNDSDGEDDNNAGGKNK